MPGGDEFRRRGLSAPPRPAPRWPCSASKCPHGTLTVPSAGRRSLLARVEGQPQADEVEAPYPAGDDPGEDPPSPKALERTRGEGDPANTNRTRALRLRRPTLYPLSYGRATTSIISGFCGRLSLWTAGHMVDTTEEVFPLWTGLRRVTSVWV